MLSRIENQDFRLKLQINLLDVCPFKSFEILSVEFLIEFWVSSLGS